MQKNECKKEAQKYCLSCKTNHSEITPGQCKVRIKHPDGQVTSLIRKRYGWSFIQGYGQLEFERIQY
jgi:hypothetical protein